jgi:hypothetical protein
MKLHTKLICMVAFLLIAGVLLLNALKKPVTVTPKTVVMYLDVSDQSKSALLVIGSMAAKAMQSMPARTNVVVIVFANDYEIIYTGLPIKGRAAFNTNIGQFLSKPSRELRVPNTNARIVLDHASSLSESLPIEVLAIYDGGLENNSVEAIAAIKKSARQLAANKLIKRVSFVGLLHEHRREWSEWLNCPGSKAVVKGRNDADSVIKEVGKW